MIPKFMRGFFAKQGGNPSGLFGRIMERRMTNRTISDATWTTSLLNIQPNSNILEIGFGGGIAIQLASEKAPQGFLAGIDRSDVMVQAARKRNFDAIKSGLMELKLGDVASIPYPDESFSIIYSLHSIYFWENPIECLKGFRRKLSPDGLLAITIQPKNKWRQEQIESPGINLFYSDQIVEMFTHSGFQNIHTESYPESGEANLHCILGNK